MTPLLVKKGLNYEVYKDPKLPRFVIIDSQKVRQVLVNLFANATKFTKKGWVKLCVTLEEPHDSSHQISESFQQSKSQCSKKNFLKFSVVDSGSGISPEVIPTLFQPFKHVQYFVFLKLSFSLSLSPLSMNDQKSMLFYSHIHTLSGKT